jgi:hypothetical protein
MNNISKRIEALDTEIQKLEKRLAEKNWERKKYMQFSDIDIKNSNKT